MSAKLWGGRFEGTTDGDVERFTSSLGIDARLWHADLRASRAHARMLGKVGVITEREAVEIVSALESIEGEMPSAEAEDVHSAIEARLAEKIGPLAGKLHTARSRNDQVATATRLYLRDEITGLVDDVARLQAWLLETAAKHVDSVMPGTTHMQHAQPVSLAHHLLAYFWMLDRDKGRLKDTSARVASLPLGAAALAGTSFPIDREMVATELGFSGLAENSLDAVSDRDFVVEFLASASLVMTHLSRLAEEIVLWNTPEFGFVTLDDSVATGSSIMPQKKNPDVAELLRGRVGRVTGALVGALTMLKGLPLSYQRDLQEDKHHLFEGLDTTRACVRITLRLLQGVTFETARMARAVRGDFSNATELADYLARKGLPFRQAHEIAGKIVRDCLTSGVALEDLSGERLAHFSPLFERDIVAALQPKAALESRSSRGGTAPDAVRAQIEKARRSLH